MKHATNLASQDQTVNTDQDLPPENTPYEPLSCGTSALANLIEGKALSPGTLAEREATTPQVIIDLARKNGLWELSPREQYDRQLATFDTTHSKELWLCAGVNRRYRVLDLTDPAARAYGRKPVKDSAGKKTGYTNDSAPSGSSDAYNYINWLIQNHDFAAKGFYLHYGFPVGACDKASLPDLFTDIGGESDGLPLAIQVELIEQVQTITGLEFATVIWSGSKSIHPHLRSVPITAEQAIHLRRLLCLILFGDFRISRLTQIMRSAGGCRIVGDGDNKTVVWQQLVSVSDKVYTYEEILEGFGKWFTHAGVTCSVGVTDDRYWEACRTSYQEKGVTEGCKLNLLNLLNQGQEAWLLANPQIAGGDKIDLGGLTTENYENAVATLQALPEKSGSEVRAKLATTLELLGSDAWKDPIYGPLDQFVGKTQCPTHKGTSGNSYERISAGTGASVANREIGLCPECFPGGHLSAFDAWQLANLIGEDRPGEEFYVLYQANLPKAKRLKACTEGGELNKDYREYCKIFFTKDGVTTEIFGSPSLKDCKGIYPTVTKADGGPFLIDGKTCDSTKNEFGGKQWSEILVIPSSGPGFVQAVVEWFAFLGVSYCPPGKPDFDFDELLFGAETTTIEEQIESDVPAFDRGLEYEELFKATQDTQPRSFWIPDSVTDYAVGKSDRTANFHLNAYRSICAALRPALGLTVEVAGIGVGSSNDLTNHTFGTIVVGASGTEKSRSCQLGLRIAGYLQSKYEPPINKFISEAARFCKAYAPQLLPLYTKASTGRATRIGLNISDASTAALKYQSVAWASLQNNEIYEVVGVVKDASKKKPAKRTAEDLNPVLNPVVPQDTDETQEVVTFTLEKPASAGVCWLEPEAGTVLSNIAGNNSDSSDTEAFLNTNFDGYTSDLLRAEEAGSGIPIPLAIHWCAQPGVVSSKLLKRTIGVGKDRENSGLTARTEWLLLSSTRQDFEALLEQDTYSREQFLEALRDKKAAGTHSKPPLQPVAREVLDALVPKLREIAGWFWEDADTLNKVVTLEQKQAETIGYSFDEDSWIRAAIHKHIPRFQASCGLGAAADIFLECLDLALVSETVQFDSAEADEAGQAATDVEKIVEEVLARRVDYSTPGFPLGKITIDTALKVIETQRITYATMRYLDQQINLTHRQQTQKRLAEATLANIAAFDDWTTEESVIRSSAHLLSGIGPDQLSNKSAVVNRLTKKTSTKRRSAELAVLYPGKRHTAILNDLYDAIVEAVLG